MFTWNTSVFILRTLQYSPPPTMQHSVFTPLCHRQPKCVRFEPNFHGDPVVMSGPARRVPLLSKQPEPTRFEARGWRQAGAARRNRAFSFYRNLCQAMFVLLVPSLWRDSHSTSLPTPLSVLIWERRGHLCSLRFRQSRGIRSMAPCLKTTCTARGACRDQRSKESGHKIAASCGEAWRYRLQISRSCPGKGRRSATAGLQSTVQVLRRL